MVNESAPWSFAQAPIACLSPPLINSQVPSTVYKVMKQIATKVTSTYNKINSQYLCSGNFLIFYQSQKYIPKYLEAMHPPIEEVKSFCEKEKLAFSFKELCSCS